MAVVNSYLSAGLICVAFAGAEAALAGGNANWFLRELKQPNWALPVAAWYAVGVLYYLACYFNLASMMRGHWSRTPEFWILVSVMALNAAWNFFFFRQKDFQKSFQVCAFYSALVLPLLFRLFAQKTIASWLLFAYAVYLPYGCLWTHRVWKMNPATTAAKQT